MQKSNKASLAFIFVTVLIDVIGIGLIIPVMPRLIESLNGDGLSDASIVGGWLVTSYAVMQFFFAPLLGSLSDKFGRKPILLIALLGLGLDYFIHAFAPTLFWLFIGRIFAGVCGASITVASAYIADISTPEKKAQNFGVIGAAFGLGFMIGPGIGGIAGEIDLKLPFFIAGGLSLLNFLYGWFMLPESHPVEKRRAINLRKANPLGAFHLLRKNPVVIGLSISFFLLYLAGHSVQSTWSFYGMLKLDWGMDTVGYSLMFVGLIVGIVQALLVKHAVKWWGERLTVFIGYICWLAGLVAFAMANTGWLLFLAILPYCFGGIASPTLQGIVSNEFKDTEQGELQGAMTALVSLTMIFGPVLMTSIFGYFTKIDSLYYFPGAPFILGALCVLVSLFVTLACFKKRAAS